MSRQPNAALSPAEVNALRRVGSGLAKFLNPSHRDMLIGMGLVAYNAGGNLVLTEPGRQRIRTEATNGEAMPHARDVQPSA